MTETNFNTYYREEDAPRPAVNFGTESLFDGLVEIFVPYGEPTDYDLSLIQDGETPLEG